MNFVILDIDLALNSYCVWLWDYSAHALPYAIVFFLLLACFVVIKYVVFIWIVGLQWLMKVDGYKYLHDYWRPFSSCKPNEKWPHITLTCYNESEKGLFYMKWLIVYRLTGVRLMSLWNVCGWFQCKEFLLRTNHRLQETVVLELTWTHKKKLKSLNACFFKNNIRARFPHTLFINISTQVFSCLEFIR